MGNEESTENFPHQESSLNTSSVFRRIKNIEDYELKPQKREIQRFIEGLKRRNVKLDFVPNFPWLMFLLPAENDDVYGLLVLEKGTEIDNITKKYLLDKLNLEKSSFEVMENCKSRLVKVFPEILKNNYIEGCFKVNL